MTYTIIITTYIWELVLDPKCNVTQLALKHGINRNRLYNWRSKLKLLPVESTNFIELSTQGCNATERLGYADSAVSCDNTETLAGKNTIKELKIKCMDYELSINGSIAGKKLLGILSAMEVIC